MDYKSKYLKYKQKYLELKHGGVLKKSMVPVQKKTGSGENAKRVKEYGDVIKSKQNEFQNEFNKIKNKYSKDFNLIKCNDFIELQKQKENIFSNQMNNPKIDEFIVDLEKIINGYTKKYNSQLYSIMGQLVNVIPADNYDASVKSMEKLKEQSGIDEPGYILSYLKEKKQGIYNKEKELQMEKEKEQKRQTLAHCKSNCAGVTTSQSKTTRKDCAPCTKLVDDESVSAMVSQGTKELSKGVTNVFSNIGKLSTNLF